ncbi:hypothetical protein TNCV_3662451 [Trichonephila clavipes]|nr:hypothetical protein TNCV_3662451 [Trichonephila clavipes]
MDKCVQKLDENPGAIRFQTARECICVFRTNRTREAEGRLLWPANEKGQGAWCGPKLVFKRVFFRRRGEIPEKKETWTVEDRDWSRKRGETMNAGVVGEQESIV